jgi:hypothetical protein
MCVQNGPRALITQSLTDNMNTCFNKSFNYATSRNFMCTEFPVLSQYTKLQSVTECNGELVIAPSPHKFPCGTDEDRTNAKICISVHFINDWQVNENPKQQFPRSLYRGCGIRDLHSVIVLLSSAV